MNTVSSQHLSAAFSSRHGNQRLFYRRSSLLLLFAILAILMTSWGSAITRAGEQSITAAVTAVTTATAKRPNVVYLLADDLGIGDVQAFNPQGKIQTPHLDALAAAGMKFTDAHSSSAVCTPSRYGILTGRYSWRSTLKSGVLYGFSPPLITSDRLTVPGFLAKQGYHTACIGKWHLGLGWTLLEDAAAKAETGWHVDYRQPFTNGPVTRGFQYFYGISASLDMPPYVFLENDRVTSIPTVEKKWIRKGPAAADFEAVDVLPRLGQRAVEYIAGRSEKAKQGEPFFLYVPLNSPHTPIAPGEDWTGKSGLGPYGDFVQQTDAVVGDILNALDRHGLAEQTIVIFTSDNGCSPSAGFNKLAQFGHNPSGPFRGYKADLFEGGHRIPFIVRWPTKIAPQTSSDQTICQVDLFATIAEILGIELPDDAGEDSVSLLPVLLGKADKPIREATVHHSINGSFAIRQGPWKLLLCPDSGGWSAPRPGRDDTSKLPAIQLYNLTEDVGEHTNLGDQHPDVVAGLTRLLEKYIAEGRSTPGSPQPNDRKVIIQTSAQASRR